MEATTNQPKILNLTDEWESVVNSRATQLQHDAAVTMRRVRTRRGIRLGLIALVLCALTVILFAFAPNLTPVAYLATCAACFAFGRFTEFCARRHRK